MGGVRALDDDNVWKILSKWASGSKIVIFTLDPEAKEACYIINESSGHWDNEGMWWSNTTYKASAWSHYVALPFEELIGICFLNATRFKLLSGRSVV